MDDSLPLRRSTRNSVALKNEELTPRKRKVSTPVKVEPSTPSRRTRASSATPKKNLVEIMNTPKKTLPVLNEEENPTNTTRTPVKKSKEISPKTPSRRRLVRESVSTPTRASVDKSTKKPIDTSEKMNVAASRPLTRAKRKTMGDIQTAEVTKTSDSEKAVQNNKDKPESKEKGVQNNKDKPESKEKGVQNNKDKLESKEKGVQNNKDKPESKEKGVQNKKDKQTIPNIGDKSDKLPDNKSDKKLDESCFAAVPRVIITDINMQQLKEAKVEENECGTFTSNSPVRAEDVAINSPRKVPEKYKSISEVSLKDDSEYINSRSQNITVDPANSISSVENTDIISVEQETSKSSVSTNLGPDIVTSPQKATDSKDNGVSNIVTTSPQKFVDSKKDDDVPNIIITSPSPQKVPDSKNIDVPNIVITFPSPQKVLDSKDNSKNGSDSSLTSEQKTSPRKTATDSSTILTDVENDVREPSKPEPLTSGNADSEMTDTADEKKLMKIDNGSSSTEKVSTSFEEIDDKSGVEEMDENSKTINRVDINKVSPTKTDLQNKEVILVSPTTSDEVVETHSPKKVDAVENVINEENTVQSVMLVMSSDETPQIIKEKGTDVEMNQIENKDSKELNKTFDKVESNQNIPDSAECIIAKDICAKKSAESDSQVLTDKNNASEMVPNGNEAITKDDATPIEDENIKETNESKLINTADETFKLETSFLNESSVEKTPEEVDTNTSNILAIEEPEEEVEITEIENEKSEDDKLTADEVSHSSAHNTSCSPDKVISSEVVSTEALDEDKETNEITTEVKMMENNSEKVDESLEETSPVKHNNASSPKPSCSAEIKPVVELKIDEDVIIELGTSEDSHENSHDSSSPLFFMKCECEETSDDSGDSGIQNDDNIIIFKMSSQFKKHMANNKENIPSRDEGPRKDVPKSEDPVPKSFDNIEAHSEDTPEEGKNKSTVLESGTSDVKLSPGKSDVNTAACVEENDHNIRSGVEVKTETIAENFPKSSESTEDSNNKITGLDAILMSPKDFLNSDEESNMDCEKFEGTQSKNERESSSENKPSEEETNTDVDNLKDSISETEDSISLNVTLNNEPGSEDSSAKVDEKQDDCDVNDITAKSAVIEVETDVNTAVLSDSKTETIPNDSGKPDGVEDTSVEQEKEKIDGSKNSSEDIQIYDNKSEFVSTNDILDKTNSLKPSNSIEENESEVSKNEINVQDSLNSSQAVCSPEIDVEKSSEDELSNNTVGAESRLENSLEDSESSESDESDTKTNFEPKKKNIKYIKNKRKNINKKFDSETDSSQSDGDSELSDSPPSNAETESSSDGPLTGKDFINFEAEEGEETSEDDSFIVSSGDSPSSSDTPSLTMKLRKRKRNLDTESSDSSNYLDSVQKLFDSYLESSKDDRQQDKFIKNKKIKLEKVSTVNKKNQRPKSILKNKPSVVESVENRNRNKSKTENKVIKETSKTGVFIVSTISQDFEEPNLSRKISKSLKLPMEQKKSEISRYDSVSKGFSVSGAGDKSVDDAALRGFVVSYDESYLVTKKPRKVVAGCSELTNKKKKIKEGKNAKKTVKKSSNSESKKDNKTGTVSPFVVTLILPFKMTSTSISSILTDLGISDISSINFPKPKVATVEFSNKEPFKKILKLYGDLKINDKPIYILDGCSYL